MISILHLQIVISNVQLNVDDYIGSLISLEVKKFQYISISYRL